jgi:hypothetical protein
MPTTDRLNNTALSSTNRSYIAVSAFHLDFFSYTVSDGPAPGFAKIGSLVCVTGGTSGNCPKGRILRENGRKLYPDAYPSINVYMVGVYDAVTGFKGFIDPNSPVFAPFNTDKPTYIGDSTDPGPGGLLDRGAPVFTNSSVEAGTSITAGTTLTATSLAVQNPIALTQATTSTLTANCATGSLFHVTLSTSDNFSIQASNVTPGQLVVFIINITGASVTPTITFGNNIRESGNLVITSGRQATATFIGYSTYLMEISRVANILVS